MKLSEIKKILAKITFAPSNLDMGWEWQAKNCTEGLLIRCSFKRPDTHSGEIGTGFGRWMFLDKDCNERSVVMTAWICARLIIEHELMEAFLFDNARILDPHKSLDELAYPTELGTGKPILTDPNGNIKGAKVFKKSAKLAV